MSGVQSCPLANAVGVTEPFSKFTKVDRFDKVADWSVSIGDSIVVRVRVTACVVIIFFDKSFGANLEHVNNVDLFEAVDILRLDVQLNLERSGIREVLVLV